MRLAPLLFESVEGIDQELARLARASGALRFGMGTGLEALARIGGHHELGFASVEAYALERCERSARWVQGVRALARHLAGLPAVRRALLVGEISLSMAQVLGKVAGADDELSWLAEARTHTVREMRLLAKQHRQGSSTPSEDESKNGGDDESEGEHRTIAEEEFATLTVTVDREDAWLFECARKVVAQVGAMTEGETIEALIGEGTTSLLSLVRRDGFIPFEGSPDDLAQRQWEAELSRWRDEAEALCEARFRATAVAAPAIMAKDFHAMLGGQPGEALQHDSAFAFEGDAAAVDSELRRLAGELARWDLALGQLAEAFWKADGWRRLGYATATQYARERLGMSWSSIKAKRALARRADKMPRLAAAVEKRELGFEAARLVASVATPETVEIWVARAAERTVRFLREEVDATQLLNRLAPGPVALPPDEATMQELAAIESRIVSGAVFHRSNRETVSDAAMQESHREIAGVTARESDRGQMSAGLGELLAGFERAQRRSPATRGARHSGRVTLRFRVTAGTQRYYRWLERLFQRHGPRGVSFLRFLCGGLIDSWKHALGSTAEYANVYGRDRYRCTSPVCGRRGVTPHHLKFRSAGGDDSDENVASLCVWCHLEGIHGGRLHASPPASDIHWTIGRAGHTRVRGRRRVIIDNAAHRA